MKTEHQFKVWVNIFIEIAAAAMGGDDCVTNLFRCNF